MKEKFLEYFACSLYIYTHTIYIYTHIQSFMVNGFSPLFSKIELGKRLGVGGGQVHDEKIT